MARLACALLALAAILAAGCGSEEAEAPPASPRPVVGPTIEVGPRGHGIEAIAVGEGGVWVALGGGCEGALARLDAESGVHVSTIRLDVIPFGVAVAEGAVWVLVERCAGTEFAVLRLDPRTERVVARIPLDLTRGERRPTSAPELVAGEGAVWAGIEFGPTEGEIVRIDPEANTIAARIDAGGYVGEMAVGGAFIWFLSHPEWTDETRIRSAGLHRIDPRTNDRTGPLVDRELIDLGASMLPPVLAAGDDAVWLRGHEDVAPHGPVVIRVDPHSGEVRRRPLSPLRWFHPLAERDSGLWALRPGLFRLDPDSLEPGRPVPLEEAIGDAAYDRERGTVWLAALTLDWRERGSVVRVELP
jgi:hypothetical protein